MLDELARGLVGAGHDVVLFATGDSTCPVTTSWVHPHAMGLSGVGPLAELNQVIAAYRSLVDCDVIHDHTLAGPLYAARFPRLAVVTTNHLPFDPSLTPLYSAIAERVPVVAISHHQASTASGLPIAEVIHHGVNVDAYPVGTGGGGYAAFLGRMHPAKGVDLAIHAARAVGMPLLIAAKMRDEGEVAYFQERVRPLLGGDVEYLGEVGGADKLELLGSAACLLNPIQWPEPFGMVMLESLACGTPVITTGRGAAPEIVDDGVTGFLCEDEPSLTDALRRAADIDRRTCRTSAEERFSAKRMVERHVALYRRLITERPPAAPSTPLPVWSPPAEVHTAITSLSPKQTV
jgi:glycosyltransferase involved in cell wall biosynthesis